MAKKKNTISKTTKTLLHRIIILITYFTYLSSCIVFILDPSAVKGVLFMFFTFYPFIFLLYLYRISKTVKLLSIHFLLKYMFLITLGIVGIIIVGGLGEALKRAEDQALRSMVSLVNSFLMLVVIVFDFYIIKKIKKIANKSKKKKGIKNQTGRVFKPMEKS